MNADSLSMQLSSTTWQFADHGVSIGSVKRAFILIETLQKILTVLILLRRVDRKMLKMEALMGYGRRSPYVQGAKDLVVETRIEHKMQ